MSFYSLVDPYRRWRERFDQSKNPDSPVYGPSKEDEEEFEEALEAWIDYRISALED